MPASNGRLEQLLMPLELYRSPCAAMITCFIGGAFICAPITKLQAQEPSVALVVPEQEHVENYDLLGDFLITNVSKLSAGEYLVSTPANIQLRVFSNNQDIKVYHSEVDDSFQLFRIYRDQGITKLDQFGNLSLEPGLQARLITDQSTKQLSLTEDTLVITEFPPITNTVVVTTAKRIVK